ncbi:tetratricopeptide repeat family protein [Asticcacaulis biprosthecium C19]|uniref:Tetratricopeptide repeat family protein n=1 Tax=Asticcacaulis biprosthecium C19 TaxID=715226 RepID=F4QJW6_9CAUL|nr:SIR2 family protein [Asticcacaulis biprosthecium]EGF93223.1 tetratricopeptide repeat family protein [Asticcacaulis biprosthecium C19]
MQKRDETLSDWVYAEHLVRTGFDFNLLESHANAHLARSLNVRKLIAVTGSGLTNGYGQPLWPSLLRNTAAFILEEIVALGYLDGATSEIATLLEPDIQTTPPSKFKTLFKTFEQYFLEKDRKSKDFAVRQNPMGNGLELVFGFEICENLYTELRRLSLPAHESGLRRDIDKRALAHLRERIKWQLRDERGRLEILLTDLLQKHRGVNQTEGSSNRNDKDGIAKLINNLRRLIAYPDFGRSPPSAIHDKQARVISSLFYLKIDHRHLMPHLGALQNYNGAIESVIDTTFSDLFKHKREDGACKPLREKASTPLQQSIVEAVYLSLKPKPLRTLLRNFNALINVVMESTKAADAAKPSPGLDALVEIAKQSRHRLPHSQDPYSIITTDLKIKRLLTTNYDGEFDSYLEHRGYREISHNTKEFSLQHKVRDHTSVRRIMVDEASYRADIIDVGPGASAYLYDYGADSRDARNQMLHIHGQARHAHSWLVLSERDYRERYARDDDPKIRNDDAMRLIFNANPLLFLGLGMKEPDILRPLRGFSQDSNHLSERPAIALLPDEDDPDTRVAKQLEAISRYGVYNIYYGEAWTTQGKKPGHMKTIMDLIWAMDKYTPEHLGKARVANAKKLKSDIISAKQKLEAAGRCLECEGVKLNAVAVQDVIDTICGLATWICAQLDSRARGCPNSDAIQVILQGVKSVVRRNFLCSKLLRTVQEWNDWKIRWSNWPKPREPFGMRDPVQLDGPPEQKIRKYLAYNDLGVESTNRDSMYFEASRHRILLKRAASVSGKPVPESAYETLAPSTDRFFSDAPSPALQMLKDSLRNGKIPLPQEGSRVFLLLGQRGGGRGQVFSSLRSHTRFAQFCDWIQLIKFDDAKEKTEEQAKTAARHIHSAFFNLGHSHEIMSVFDRLCHLLSGIICYHINDVADALIKRDQQPETSEEPVTAEAQKSMRDHIAASLDAIRQNRVERLRYCLELLAAKGSSTVEGRIIIAVNNVNMFFNKDGEAKNAQIKQLFGALVDDRYKSAPIDYVFLAHDTFTASSFASSRKSDQSPPEPLEGKTPKAPNASPCFRALWPANVTPDLRADYEERLSRGRLEWCHPETTDNCRFFVHPLSWMRPIALAVRFFPIAASALNLMSRASDAVSTRTDMTVYISTEGNSDDFEESRKQHLPDIKNIRWFRHSRHGLDEHVRKAFETALAQRKKASLTERQFEDLMLTCVDTYQRVMTGNSEKPLADNVLKAREDTAGKVILDTIQDQKFEDKKPPFRNYFHEIARSVGHNRFAMTLVLALIEDMIARRIERQPHGFVDLAPVENFIEKLALAAVSLSPDNRADAAVEIVLNQYRIDSTSSLGHPLSTWPYTCRVALILEQISDETRNRANLKAKRKARGFSRERSSSENVHEYLCLKANEEDLAYILENLDHKALVDLQEAILVHLSIIGQPVDIAVLSGIGAIAKHFDGLISSIKTIKADFFEGAEQARETAIYYLVLDLMVHRCLIFRIAPKGAEYHHNNRRKHRFTTHKSLRRRILRQFNAPPQDYSELDQLTVSMYPTQPNDFPRPSAEGHRRIRQLIDDLSGFEQVAGSRAHVYKDPLRDYAENDGERDAIDRARLRGAIGPLRSFYSVGVVSRFNTYQDEGLPTPDAGYFEAIRLRVRWLLRRAVHLDGAAVPETDDFTDLCTFHAEEIVWLFNECGVLSLASGRMTDASLLLNQARMVTRRYIENQETGPLHNRINLNFAITAIERGRLHSARDLLAAIAKDEDETKSINMIAKGYLAMIDDLMGAGHRALPVYKLVSEGLMDIRRYRAAAIMLIHYGDCLRRLGKFPEALENIRNACSLAANGGHEDVRQTGILAEAWVRIMQCGEQLPQQEKDDLNDVLDQIEAYANVMGMPRLISGASLARAQFLINKGESRNAIDAAQRALLLATRHDTELQKISALSLLGIAMHKLNLPEAQNVLIRARELAYYIEYNSEVVRLEEYITQQMLPMFSS